MSLGYPGFLSVGSGFLDSKLRLPKLPGGNTRRKSFVQNSGGALEVNGNSSIQVSEAGGSLLSSSKATE